MRRSRTIVGVVLLAVIFSVPLARAGFGPWWGASLGAAITTNKHKGLEDFTFAGAFGDWCATSATCPATVTYNLTWNLNARVTLGTAWERLEADQAIMDGGCTGTPNFGSYGNAVNGTDPNIGMDATVSGLQSKGISIIMLLGVIANCEASGGAGNCYCLPANINHWATNWVAKVATHYSPRGVHVYEIFNETNGNGSTPPPGGSFPTAAQYASMMCAAWTAIRGVDSSAVIMPSLLTANGTIYAPTFLTNMYSGGLHGCFNAIANHPYPQEGPTNNYILPGSTYQSWPQMYSTSPSLLSIMQANGDGNNKFYLTEIGCSDYAGQTLEPFFYCGNASSSNPAINQGQQMIIDAFNPNGPVGSFLTAHVAAIIWWEELDNPNYTCNANADAAGNCAGLYRQSGALAPMGSTFAGVSGTW